jgi:peroxiredoxin
VNPKRLLIPILAFGVVFGIYFFGRSRFRRQLPASGGAVAPDFSLPNLAGGELSLSAYRGKVVLLDFWATWCDPCRDEIPRFVDLQTKFGDRGLQIIGVSMDDGPEPVRDFYQRFKMNYPVVIGNAKIGELYGGVLGLPIAFLVGRDGRIYSKHTGATDSSVFEKEILNLLQNSAPSNQIRLVSGAAFAATYLRRPFRTMTAERF